MIPPEQLVGALERLDPRERELLALSLRRRVPDEALARVYDVEAHEVARRRAAAIERLADEVGARRGEDLGAILQALLDEGTWSAARLTLEPDRPEAETAPGPERDAHEHEAAAGNGSEHAALRAAPADAAAADPPEDATAADPPEDATAADPPGEAASAPALVEERPPLARPLIGAGPRPRPRPVPLRAPAVVPVATEPVLEMLAAREGIRPPAPELALPARRRRRRGSLVGAVAASFVAAVLGGAAAIAGWSEWGEDAGSNGGARTPDGGARHFIPALGGPLEAPFPSEPQSISCYSTAYVSGPTTLYDAPGGDVRIRLSAKTEWGSDRVFGVVRRRGDWIAVQAPELENDEVAWMPASVARLDCVRWSMHADLSKRLLYVRRDGHTVRKFVIAVGRRRNPTPEGRYSVTDKLRVTDKGSPYGCCVLAVTGHQRNLPPSWPGGDRLAVHATRELSSLGEARTLGCLRVTEDQARWLIRTMPLGAPLFVRT